MRGYFSAFYESFVRGYFTALYVDTVLFEYFTNDELINVPDRLVPPAVPVPHSHLSVLHLPSYDQRRPQSPPTARSSTPTTRRHCRSSPAR